MVRGGQQIVRGRQLPMHGRQRIVREQRNSVGDGKIVCGRQRYEAALYFADPVYSIKPKVDLDL